MAQPDRRIGSSLELLELMRQPPNWPLRIFRQPRGLSGQLTGPCPGIEVSY